MTGCATGSFYVFKLLRCDGSFRETDVIALIGLFIPFGHIMIMAISSAPCR